MAGTLHRGFREPLHPLHAFLLAAMVPLFVGALLSDLAYNSSYEIQWKNFASWLIVGGLVFGGFAFLWALIDEVRANREGERSITYLLVLLATGLLAFTNALVHAKDAWASMPAALMLSILVALLSIAAAWLGFSTFRSGRTR